LLGAVKNHQSNKTRVALLLSQKTSSPFTSTAEMIVCRSVFQRCRTAALFHAHLLYNSYQIITVFKPNRRTSAVGQKNMIIIINDIIPQKHFKALNFDS
jgi:hypothetical protein